MLTYLLKLGVAFDVNCTRQIQLGFLVSEQPISSAILLASVQSKQMQEKDISQHLCRHIYGIDNDGATIMERPTRKFLLLRVNAYRLTKAIWEQKKNKTSKI